MATHSSILENHMDRGDWKVHGVTKSQTQLSTHAHIVPGAEIEAVMLRGAVCTPAFL